MSKWEDLIGQAAYEAETWQEAKVKTLAGLLERAERSLKTLTEIVTREFSYDGVDPDGVKRYQSEVNLARGVMADLARYKEGDESEAR